MKVFFVLQSETIPKTQCVHICMYMYLNAIYSPIIQSRAVKFLPHENLRHTVESIRSSFRLLIVASRRVVLGAPRVSDSNCPYSLDSARLSAWARAAD